MCWRYLQRKKMALCNFYFLYMTSLFLVPHSSNWKCYVDGRETDVYKGNKLYMAVRLEEGSHDILFVYRNDSFLIGSMLSFVALLIIIIKVKELPV